MTWRLMTSELHCLGPFDYLYRVSNGTMQFQVVEKEDAEWLCNTLDDYDTLKKTLDSLSLGDNFDKLDKL